MDLASAYATCEQITRVQARNFHYGIRLLPPDRRGALSAVYAFARRVDDVGDGDLPLDERQRLLAACRHDLHHLEDRDDDPVLVGLAGAARRHPIPLEAFDDLIDGVAMDLDGTRYATFDDLVVYCRRVAGSIGRLCLGVFGGGDGDDRAWRFADDLGVALQVTNILRDVREDLDDDRVYLPAADLDRFGADPAVPDRRFEALVRFEAARARGWFDRGFRLLPHLDRRSAACVAAMAGIYHELLGRIEADPLRVHAERVSLTGWQKTGVALRSLVAGSRAGVAA